LKSVTCRCFGNSQRKKIDICDLLWIWQHTGATRVATHSFASCRECNTLSSLLREAYNSNHKQRDNSLFQRIDLCHCNTRQRTAPCCTTLHHTTTHCSTLQHTPCTAPGGSRRIHLYDSNTLEHATPRCTTLEHTA